MITATALFFFTAASIASVFMLTPSGPAGAGLDRYRLLQIAAMASPLAFLLACIGVFFRSRIGYGVGLVAGLVALSGFTWMELSMSPWRNCWIALNLSGRMPGDKGDMISAKLRILAVTLAVFSVVYSAIRLLPPHWKLRNRSLSERTWPCLAACFLVLATWFGWAVMPYRLPGMITRGLGPEWRMLHVEKRGLQFHEVAIGAWGNKFSVGRNDRRLFQYRFEEDEHDGEMPQSVALRVAEMLQSLRTKELHTLSPKALREWNAEGWYIHIEGRPVLVFNSEHGTQPPQEVIDVFHEIEKLPSKDDWERETRDICMGFCYDPLSGLGFKYANERCFTGGDGITRCR